MLSKNSALAPPARQPGNLKTSTQRTDKDTASCVRFEIPGKEKQTLWQLRKKVMNKLIPKKGGAKKSAKKSSSKKK
jgi:hypothetical protein